MKTIVLPAAYESPMTKVVIVEIEGVLCQSTLNGVGHDGFTKGDDLNF